MLQQPEGTHGESASVEAEQSRLSTSQSIVFPSLSQLPNSSSTTEAKQINSPMDVLQVVPLQTNADKFQQKRNAKKVKFNASEEVIPADPSSSSFNAISRCSTCNASPCCCVNPPSLIPRLLRDHASGQGQEKALSHLVWLIGNVDQKVQLQLQGIPGCRSNNLLKR